MSVDKMVDTYVRMRDHIAEQNKLHKENMSRFVLAMNKLEGLLLDALNNTGVESMRAPAGTFYKVKHISCTVEDWPQTLTFIRDNQAWDLLESRVNKTAVQGRIEDTGEVPPGVKIVRTIEVNVRRA